MRPRRGSALFTGAVLACVTVLGAPTVVQARALDGPVIAQHSDISAPATETCVQTPCTNVFYTLDVSGGTPPYFVNCNLKSGQPMLLGAHAIQCYAQDSRGSTSRIMSFTVTVTPPSVDTDPPVISNVPSDITATATSASGAVVAFATPTGLDTVDGPVLVSCDHRSGETFPIGTTTVTCSAADGHRNTATATFSITVDAAPSSPGSSGGSSGAGAPAAPFVADVTGCGESTCMSNTISFLQLDGCTCDFGSFLWSKTSYTLQRPGTISPTIEIETGNETSDVEITFVANGTPVGVASTQASGQQSGISYTSSPITLTPGTNVVTVTAVDPLQKLAATVYTVTFEYQPSDTGSDGAGSTTSTPPEGSGSGPSTGSGSSTGGGSPTGSGSSAPAPSGGTSSVSTPSSKKL